MMVERASNPNGYSGAEGAAESIGQEGTPRTHDNDQRLRMFNSSQKNFQRRFARRIFDGRGQEAASWHSLPLAHVPLILA
jgi:hypothetical protein